MAADTPRSIAESVIRRCLAAFLLGYLIGTQDALVLTLFGV